MKSAFVTGSVTGIGEGMVLLLQEKGWQVFAGYRSTLPEKASWFGKPGVIPVRCDITDPDELGEAAVEVAAKTGSGLDLLINNAGFPSNSGVIEAADMEDYRYTFEVNFWGPMNVIQAFVPLLKQSRGRIINVTSASVYLTIPMGSSYPVSKVAFKALSRHLRMELEPFGVQVTALDPAGVETSMAVMTDSQTEQQWSAIPEALRGEYQEYFKDSATAIGSSFKLYSPEKFASEVYRRVITARKMKVDYIIGPGATALPLLHRFLPVQQVENIWKRMFRL